MRYPVVAPRALVLPALLVALASCGDRLLAADQTEGKLREFVLFPFDDYGLPFNKGLVLTLVHKSATEPSLGVDARHPGTPVMSIGKRGDPDFPRAYFDGTILHVEGEYRMWYSGFDGEARRVCYAVSKDGTHWVKPKLGLVDYHGSKENNLVPGDNNEAMRALIVLVLHDPDEPDPGRRFKMIREVNPVQKLAAVSADGIQWKSVAGNQDILTGVRGRDVAARPAGLLLAGSIRIRVNWSGKDAESTRLYAVYVDTPSP